VGVAVVTYRPHAFRQCRHLGKSLAFDAQKVPTAFMPYFGLNQSLKNGKNAVSVNISPLSHQKKLDLYSISIINKKIVRLTSIGYGLRWTQVLSGRNRRGRQVSE
jgi:hypothetical protein